MKPILRGLALAAIALLTVACSGGGSSPAPGTDASPSPGASAPAGEGNVIVAKDLKFLTTSLAIPADTATEIVLDNQEAAPHNIAIKDAGGVTLFKGKIVSSAKETNAVPALPAGNYTFWCEVHPDMTGTLTVG